MAAMTSGSDPRTYGHFCMLAKALEHVGDRWTLLVVRDLMVGPKRFTDLMERMAGITPKTLTRRLRELEADGLVEADREVGRREVWYRLTPAGQDLQPALEELLLWGLRNLPDRPRPGEPIHPEHVLRALQLQLQREGVDSGSVRWAVDVPGTGNYTLIGNSGRWDLRSDESREPAADVTITATRSALARFLTAPPPRDPDAEGIEITGKASAIRAFLKAITVFPPDSPLTDARQMPEAWRARAAVRVAEHPD
jgi:DNA-binding HxlR family transcriptional regulator